MPPSGGTVRVIRLPPIDKGIRSPDDRSKPEWILNTRAARHRHTGYIDANDNAGGFSWEGMGRCTRQNWSTKSFRWLKSGSSKERWCVENISFWCATNISFWRTPISRHPRR
jgi:hypothetical protein